MEQDPVCGMSVDSKTALSTTHQGQTYYFCSAGCKQQFEDHPGKYTRR